jgi:hypothetical protein
MPERPTAATTIDQTAKPNPDSEPETVPETKSRIDLSLAQVLGGALAAMTAAALGSRFSLAGTVVGAALASVIAAVSGALYTASLRRTRATVRAVIGGRLTDPAGSSSSQSQPGSGVSSVVAPSSVPSLARTVDRSAKASRRRALLVRSLVGAAAIFALAAGGLTIYEAASGHALSGGRGTTFSQVQQGGRQVRTTNKETPAPSRSADSSPTAAPSAEPSVTPTAEVSPTVDPSAEPSVTPEAVPSVTAAPPSVVPSQPIQPSR